MPAIEDVSQIEMARPFNSGDTTINKHLIDRNIIFEYIRQKKKYHLLLLHFQLIVILLNTVLSIQKN